MSKKDSSIFQVKSDIFCGRYRALSLQEQYSFPIFSDEYIFKNMGEAFLIFALQKSGRKASNAKGMKKFEAIVLTQSAQALCLSSHQKNGQSRLFFWWAIQGSNL